MKVYVDKIGNRKVRSENYNYNFDYKNGLFQRWGKTLEDDPQFALPEILDIEVSTICSGIDNKPCKFCYKSNSFKGKNMSFDTFKKVLDKMPMTLTQIAFGIGNLDVNKDLEKMFEYCRLQKVVPNLTINGNDFTDNQADFLTKYLGACAVSRYEPKDICYNAIEKLTDRGMKQINIHQLLSEDTFDKCMQTLKDYLVDKRLSKLNAIVFLMLKPKGNRNTLNKISSIDKYKELVKFALDNKIPIGFDSCSAHSFLKSVKDNKDYKYFESVCEPCESSCFSSYVNVDGKYSPCSFCDGEKDWEDSGIDVVKSKDFIKDVWLHDRTKKFRKKLLDNNRQCPIFDLEL